MFTLNVMDMTGVTTVLHVQPTFTVKHIKSQLAKTIGLEPAVINLAIDRRAEERHGEGLGGCIIGQPHRSRNANISDEPAYVAKMWA